MGDHVRSKRRWVVGVTATIVLLGLLSQSNRVRGASLLVPSISGFVEVAPDVWVERGMGAAERDRVVGAVPDARKSIERFFSGEPGGSVVLACASARCFRRCGGIGRATTFFGNRVLLSPDGVSSVKLSHEFSHVELATRVGVVRALVKVPRWFDEGLAVLVSADPDFVEARWLAATDNGARAPSLDRLATLRGWLSVDRELSYGTARHEVARWYARAGRSGLDRLFAALRAGETFERSYTNAEIAGP